MRVHSFVFFQWIRLKFYSIFDQPWLLYTLDWCPMLSNWQNNFNFMICRWPIDTRLDKIRRKRLQAVRPPLVTVIIAIIITAATGPSLQQRAILKTTAPRVSVGRLIRTAWSCITIRVFSQTNIKKVSLLNRLCHGFNLSFIHSNSSTGCHPYLPSSINLSFSPTFII